MPTIIRPPTTIKVVPRDGEIEITLNINISVDGKVVAQADNAEAHEVERDTDDKIPFLVPELSSGFKLDFGKKEGGA